MRAVVPLALALSISSVGCSLVSGRPVARADREPGASRCGPTFPPRVDAAVGAAAAGLALGAGIAARNNCPESGSCTGWRTTAAVASGSAIGFFVSGGYGAYLLLECDPLFPVGDAAGGSVDWAPGARLRHATSRHRRRTERARRPRCSAISYAA